MQIHLPKPEDKTYGPGEFSEFFQDNWVYLAMVVVVVYIVIMYSKILKERKRNKDN